MGRKKKTTATEAEAQVIENTELENAESEEEEEGVDTGSLETSETTEAPVEAAAETQVELETPAEAPPPVPKEYPAPVPEVKTDEDGDEVITLPIPKARASAGVKVTETPQVEKAPASLDTISLANYIRHKYKFNLGSAGPLLTSAIEFLDRYEERMRGGMDVDQAQGESLQRQLFKTYLTIFSLGDMTERQVGMEVLLWKFFKNEKSAFSVIALARFTRGGRWPIQELNMYLQLNHVFNRIKNPMTRGIELKQFKISAIVGAFPTDKARYTEGFLNWTTTL